MKTADLMITHAEHTSNVAYRDCPAQDRLAYRVGMLESYIKELCFIIENHEKEMSELLEKQLKEREEA